MDNITGKRRGRPRKVVAVPNAAAEGEDAAIDGAGDGQAGQTGFTAPAKFDGQGEDWDSFVVRLSDPLLRKVWHPEPKMDVIPRGHAAFLHCEQGPIKGQLQDGTIIDL